MKKKKGSGKMEGKMCALKELHSLASGMMSDDVDKMQKVTVAAKNKKGLKEGLEKAKELLKKKA